MSEATFFLETAFFANTEQDWCIGNSQTDIPKIKRFILRRDTQHGFLLDLIQHFETHSENTK
jgi:hypothetical protein